MLKNINLENKITINREIIRVYDIQRKVIKLIFI